MRIWMVGAIAGCLVAALALAQEIKKATVPQPTATPAPAGATIDAATKQKYSYSIGLSLGKQVKSLPIDIDVDMLQKGLRDVVTGTKPMLTEDEMKEALGALQKSINAREMKARADAAAKAKAAGDSYMADNAKKPGVTVLPNGLQYKVLKEGTGATPTDTDLVKTHYQGTLVDGTEFDSSYKRGEPATFPVNGVIRGWTEALKRMKVGSKWQLVVPPDLAYGDNPPPGAPIPPGATLVFEIELLGIEKGEK
jgi:FKBP-type peptidyl-prolyl cis-trans isomerase